MYRFGVEFEMDAIEAGPNADLELKYYLNPEKTCYFEFDDNKTLKFVTELYKWNNQTSAPDALFKDLLLAEQNLDKLYLGTNDELVKAIRINSYWPLGIPQITFQIPLLQYENLRNFATSIFMDSENRLKCFDFNMPTISPFGADAKKDPEVKGLAYFCIVTIKCLQTKEPSSREVGPKSCLPFISKIPFRTMYLGLTKEQRELFNEYILAALDFVNIRKQSPLFKDYTTSLGIPLSKACTRTFTVQDFINSMTQDNYDYSFERSFERSKRDPNKTDLLSPPPFMEESYAMGALKNPDISKHFILEFRFARGSIFHFEKINYGTWALSSSAEQKEASVFYFYHFMIKSFEEFFISITYLKKIGPLDMKPIVWVWPPNNRNLLWQRIVIIRRRRFYLEEDKTVESQILRLIEVFKDISEEEFREKFSKIFENFDDAAIEKRVKSMNDSDQDNFCSIATELLLEYDSYLSKYLSVFKSKDNK